MEWPSAPRGTGVIIKEFGIEFSSNVTQDSFGKLNHGASSCSIVIKRLLSQPFGNVDSPNVLLNPAIYYYFATNSVAAEITCRSQAELLRLFCIN